MFTYTAYTLRITSGLELPELLPIPDTGARADVTICAEPWRTETVSDDTYHSEPQHFGLVLAGVAAYEVSSGNKITVKIAPDADLREVRLFLLGTCFGILLHQRGILAFHASTVLTPRGAVLFTGPSGIGKSTLLYTLTQRGYTMLSDDVIGICSSDVDVPTALPSFPRSKLRDDSARTLGLEPAPEDASQPTLDKTQLDLRRVFSPVSAPVHHIYALHADDAEEIHIVPKNPFEAFTSAVENTYRAEFLDAQSLRSRHFGAVARLVTHARVFDVFRPRTPFEPFKLAKALEQHFLA